MRSGVWAFRAPRLTHCTDVTRASDGVAKLRRELAAMETPLTLRQRCVIRAPFQR